MASWEVSQDKSSGGYFTLTILGLCNQAEVDAVRSHPRAAATHQNIFAPYGAQKLRVLIWADSYEEAEQIRDWMQEETLRPDEAIKHDWSDYLDALTGEE